MININVETHNKFKLVLDNINSWKYENILNLVGDISNNGHYTHRQLGTPTNTVIMRYSFKHLVLSGASEVILVGKNIDKLVVYTIRDDGSNPRQLTFTNKTNIELPFNLSDGEVQFRADLGGVGELYLKYR